MKRWKQIEFSLYLNSPFLISKTHQKEILKRKLSEFSLSYIEDFFFYSSRNFLVMKTASHERKNIKDRSLNHDSHYRENVVRESCCMHSRSDSDYRELRVIPVGLNVASKWPRSIFNPH